MSALAHRDGEAGVEAAFVALAAAAGLDERRRGTTVTTTAELFAPPKRPAKARR